MQTNRLYASRYKNAMDGMLLIWLTGISTTVGAARITPKNGTLVTPMSIITKSSDNLRTDTLSERIFPGWTLHCPLLLEVIQDTDGSYIVSEDLFGIYGHGSTLEEAKRDYSESLIDMYHSWEADARAGNRAAQEAFQFLQQYLSRTQE